MFTTRYQDLDTLIMRDKSHKTAAGRQKWIDKQVAAGAIKVMALSDPTPQAAPASTVAATSRCEDRVVETRTVSPKVASTRVVDDSLTYAWLVTCEDRRCTHQSLVAKYQYHPVSFANPDGPMIKTVFTAPSRRFCGLHVPRS